MQGTALAVSHAQCARSQIGLRLKRDLTDARETFSVPQSTDASAAEIQATFICGEFIGWAYAE